MEFYGNVDIPQDILSVIKFWQAGKKLPHFSTPSLVLRCNLDISFSSWLIIMDIGRGDVQRKTIHFSSERKKKDKTERRRYLGRRGLRRTF